MDKYHSILILALLALLLALAGCTGSQAPPAASQQQAGPASPPASSAAAAASSGSNLVPSPTDSIIDANKVNFNIEKDNLANVNVEFQGGSGLQQVNSIDVTLNRADGQVKTATVGIRVGDNAVLEGTKDTDRIQVFVSMKDGKRYKLIDQLLPYRTRG